jgi:hypothetical protein
MTHTGFAVDIDDTIAQTALRVSELTLERFGHPKKYSAKKLIELYDQPGKVPEWDTPQIQEHIASLLQDFSFLGSIPAAHEAVSALHTLPVACYISSRFQETLNTTTQWLARHDFPTAPVILRNTETVSPQWKIAYLKKHLPNCLGLIDDSPGAFPPTADEIPFPLYWFNRYNRPPHPNLTVQMFSRWTELEQFLNK